MYPSTSISLPQTEHEMHRKFSACMTLMLLVGSPTALAQEALSASEARAIERDFVDLLAGGYSNWRRCSDYARYSDPSIVEQDIKNGIARLKIRIKVTNQSADIMRDPKLIDCFGGQRPRRGEAVDVVLSATYRKTKAGWEYD